MVIIKHETQILRFPGYDHVVDPFYDGCDQDYN